MIIAHRLFDMGGKSVSLSIYAPVADGDDYRCDYVIAWPSRERRSKGWGVDALQALQLTLQKAHLDLLSSPPGRRGEMHFLGSRDLGLPLADGVTAADFIGQPVPLKPEPILMAPFSPASCADGGHCHIVRYDPSNDRIETHRLMPDGTTSAYTVVERTISKSHAGKREAELLGEALLSDTDFGRRILTNPPVGLNRAIRD
jgi:hypothetical protein